MFLVYTMLASVELICLASLIFSLTQIFNWNRLTEKQQVASGELLLTSVFGLMIFTGLLFL